MKKAECWLPDPYTKLLGMYVSLVRVDSPVTSEDSENDSEVLVWWAVFNYLHNVTFLHKFKSIYSGLTYGIRFDYFLESTHCQVTLVVIFNLIIKLKSDQKKNCEDNDKVVSRI